MSYLDTLRKRRVAPNATRHLLRISIQSKKYHAFLIVEGDDDESFYSYFFEQRFPELIFQVIVADGKGGVLALRDFVDKQFDDEQVLFFVDRDHDDFLKISYNRSNTYVTDGYSIESFFCSTDVFVDIFRRCYSINLNDPILRAFQNFLECNLKKTNIRLRSVMAIVIHLRTLDIDPDLERLTFNLVFSLCDHNIRRRPLRIRDIVRFLGYEGSVSLSELIASMRTFRAIDDNLIIRGKNALGIYFEILRAFVANSNNKKSNDRPLKARLQLGGKGFINYALHYIECPQSLENFFAHNSSKIAN